ncbi:MAG: single-stranded DNA-binding protein [Paraclostridium sp.]
MSIVIHLTGRLGADPKKLEETNTTTFNLCTDINKKEATKLWSYCAIHGSAQDGKLPYLRKGKLINVVGEITKLKTFAKKDTQGEYDANLYIKVVSLWFPELPKPKTEEQVTE